MKDYYKWVDPLAVSFEVVESNVVQLLGDLSSEFERVVEWRLDIGAVSLNLACTLISLKDDLDILSALTLLDCAELVSFAHLSASDIHDLARPIATVRLQLVSR